MSRQKLLGYTDTLAALGESPLVRAAAVAIELGNETMIAAVVDEIEKALASKSAMVQLRAERLTELQTATPRMALAIEVTPGQPPKTTARVVASFESSSSGCVVLVPYEAAHPGRTIQAASTAHAVAGAIQAFAQSAEMMSERSRLTIEADARSKGKKK